MNNENVTPCFRFVNDDLQSVRGDVQWKIGEWQKLDKNWELLLCNYGLHASRTPYHSSEYGFGTRWFLAEARGKIKEEADKFCSYEMRLVKEIPRKTMLKFLVSCVKHAIHTTTHKEIVTKALEAIEAYIDTPTQKNLAKLKDIALPIICSSLCYAIRYIISLITHKCQGSPEISYDISYVTHTCVALVEDACKKDEHRHDELEWQTNTLLKMLEYKVA